MSERLWWPADWADEIMPPSRPSPDGFLIDADGHYFLGYAFDAEDASHFDKRYFQKGLDRGDIVDFICCDGLGTVDVTINPDGSYVAHGPVPERATHFCIAGNPDTLADSLARLVQNEIEMEPKDEPETVTISMAWWSDAIPHKLIVTYDEAQRHCVRLSFAQVSAAEARQ